MNIDPILQAPAAVKIHLATVLPAFAIVGGLLLAGAFTLLPGRIMHQFFFG